VKIRISDRSVRLRPGMSATADIETDTVQNVVAVPIQSVTVRNTDSNLSPEEREKRDAQRVARDQADNAAEVTNETLQKQKERGERDKLQRVVFVRNGETVRMQKVTTGISDSTHIEIKSGLKPGDEVVSGSYTAISRKLKDGAKVQLEKDEK
jgi:HlyD family secretion protein